MMEKTARCLEAGVENLCEASFRYEGLYCAVDILRKQGGGYAIYEVKSASHPAEIYGGSYSSTVGKTRRQLTHIRKIPLCRAKTPGGRGGLLRTSAAGHPSTCLAAFFAGRFLYHGDALKFLI